MRNLILRVAHRWSLFFPSSTQTGRISMRLSATDKILQRQVNTSSSRGFLICVRFTNRSSALPRFFTVNSFHFLATAFIMTRDLRMSGSMSSEFNSFFSSNKHKSMKSSLTPIVPTANVNRQFN